MKNDLCANDGYIPVARRREERGLFWYIECCHCGQRTKLYKSEKKATRKWNNQQRQAKPREWKDEITKAFRVLRRTIGSQEWLDYLMPDDIINIRDNFIPVFKKHLEMRKLVVQPKTELQKLRTDTAQQIIIIGQLRERIQELEKAQDKPLVDFDKVLLENEQLREQSRQLARTLTKLAAALGKVE